MESLGLRGAAYVKFGVEHPEHYRILMMTKTSEPRHSEMPEVPTQGDIAFAHLVEAATRCIESGQIKAMDPLEASLMLWAGVHGLTSLMIATPNDPWPENVVDLLLETMIQGLAPR